MQTAALWPFNVVTRRNFETGTVVLSENRCLLLSVLIENGSLNTLKVVSQGQLRKFYLNGRHMCDIFVSGQFMGSVMVVARMPDSPAGHAFEVRSVRIKARKVDAAAAEDAAVMDPAAFAPASARTLPTH